MLFTVLLRPTALELLPTTLLKSPWTLLHTPDTCFGTGAVRAGHFVVALAGHSRNSSSNIPDCDYQRPKCPPQRQYYGPQSQAYGCQRCEGLTRPLCPAPKRQSRSPCSARVPKMQSRPGRRVNGLEKVVKLPRIIRLFAQTQSVGARRVAQGVSGDV